MNLNRTSILLILLLNSLTFKSHAQQDSSASRPISVVVIPHRPMMHLSDSDNDIAAYSDKNPAEIRSILRKGLVNKIYQRLQTEYQISVPEQDFVQRAEDETELLYHSMSYSSETVYSLKEKKGRDTLQIRKKLLAGKQSSASATGPADTSYINVSFHDQQLLPELANRHNADYFIFLNELDIKTNFKDCMDLALKIYQRELKVHYTIFDRNGKQVWGDVAVVKFPSNSNDVGEIMNTNFPLLSDQIGHSLQKVK